MFVSYFTADGFQRAVLPISPSATLPSCLWSRRIFPSLPGPRLTIFYRDASSALVHNSPCQPIVVGVVACSRSHASRYKSHKTNSGFRKNRTRGFRTSLKCIALTADGPQRAMHRLLPIPPTAKFALLPVVTNDLPTSPRFSPYLYNFLSRSKFSSYNSPTRI